MVDVRDFMNSMPSHERYKILVVENDETERNLLAELLRSQGHQTEVAVDGLDALTKLETFEPEIILTDLEMPGMDGFQLLNHLQQQESKVPVIALTGLGSIEKALAIVHDLKAFWFLEKPISREVLMPLLQRAAAQNHYRREAERMSAELSMRGLLGNLVGQSDSMQRVFSQIRQVAPSSATVMITGESGTGKEMVAREIHRLSTRGSGPFVAVNCAAIPEALIESELFGYEKGSFTGAVERRAGCFEQAHQGTLLLDEIGEMPISIQAKFLRVLEDMKVRRLGAKTEADVNVRIISATNRCPEEAIQAGKLREDLFYRLNVFRIDLPPLRDRKEDIASIAETMIHELNRRHNTRVTQLEKDAIDLLEAHDWPGNVRELRNVIERAVILANEGPVYAKHLRINQGGSMEPVREPESGLHMPPGRRLSEIESSYIQLTLKHLNHNRKLTADTLGISIRTLQTRIAEFKAEANTNRKAARSAGDMGIPGSEDSVAEMSPSSRFSSRT